MFTEIDKCRSCGYEHLEILLDLGESTPAGVLLWEDQLHEADIAAPLVLVFCSQCSLVQLNQTVSPQRIYCNDYTYLSSVSNSLLDYYKKSADALIRRKKLDTKSLVVEAASNDGYMLQNFVERDIPVLGIDPAAGPAHQARTNRIETMTAFFSTNVAESLVEEGKCADLFIANMVLSHADDLNDFVRAIYLLLKNDGLAVLEVNYLLDLLDNYEFDTIYHGNLCYFSAMSLTSLFEKHGLFINDIQRTKIHGGSLRLFVEKRKNIKDSVPALLAFERGRGIHMAASFTKFAKHVQLTRRSLATFLSDLKDAGNTIVGYGAGAKATTMLSYCGIDNSLLDYIVDLNPMKQGRYLSSQRLPVFGAERLLEDMPDYVLVLAWNFSREIINQQKQYYQRGGEFIIPIPTAAIVSEAHVNEILSMHIK